MVKRMGNIGFTYIKQKAEEFINMYIDKFASSNYQYNKEKVFEIADFDGKLMRNRIRLYYKNIYHLKNSKVEVS